MALRSFGARDLDALVGLGHVGADEAAALEREQEALGRLRFGLHLVAGRHEERLRFDYQKTLAARLGYADDDRNLGVEQMMQGFYRAAAVVRREVGGESCGERVGTDGEIQGVAVNTKKK